MIHSFLYHLCDCILPLQLYFVNSFYNFFLLFYN
nr:MAG TPA: hypothetical protein [Bacteriophage sp.]